MLCLFRFLVLLLFSIVSLQAEWPEALVDSSNAGERSPDNVGAIGGGWFAMREDWRTISVIDIESGDAIGRIEFPSVESGDFEIELFRTIPSADGDRLAVLCSTRGLTGGVWNGQTGLALAVWEVPSLELIGISKIEGGSGGYPFLSVAHGRVVVFHSDQSGGKFLQWDAEDLEPMLSVPLPNGVRAPDSAPSYDGYGKAWHGDGVLAYSTLFELNSVVAVDLNEGTVVELEIPAGFRTMHGTSEPSGFGKTFLVPLETTGTTTTSAVGFFDLEERSFLGGVQLVGAPRSNQMLISVSEDGYWQAFVGSSETYLFSGNGLSLDLEGGLRTGLEPNAAFSTRYGLPYAHRQGRIWFQRSGLSLINEYVFHARLDGQPIGVGEFDAPSAAEADGSMSLTFRLDAPVDRELLLEIETIAGTATSGADYANFPNTLRIPPGVSSVTINTALRTDLVAESDEYFEVEIRDPSGSLMIPHPRKACVIEGSKPITVGFTESWREGDATKPLDTALVSGVLVQTNTLTGSDYSVVPPKVMLKPLVGGGWTPSRVWSGDPIRSTFDHVVVKGSSGSTVLIVESGQPEEAVVFDAERDELLFRRTGLFFGSSFDVDVDSFLYEEFYAKQGLWETKFGAEDVPRQISDQQTADMLAYSDRFFVELGQSDEVRLYSRESSALIGEILSTKPWIGQARLHVHGEVLMVVGEKIVVCDLSEIPTSGPPSDVAYKTLQPPGGRSSEFDEAVIAADMIVTAKIDDLLRIEFNFYDSRSADWLGATSCALPEGLPDARSGTYLRSLWAEGSDLIAAFENRGRYEIVHLDTSTLIPGFRVPANLREGGGGLRLELNEAASVPMHVGARLVSDDAFELSRWVGGGDEVSISVGQSLVNLPLTLRDDGIPMPDGYAQIEVMIRVGELESRSRVNVFMLDNDIVSFDTVDLLGFPWIESLQPFDEGWVGLHRDSGLPQFDLLRWSEDVFFQDHHPVVPLDNTVPFHIVESVGGWLAVRTPEVFGPTPVSGLAAQLIVYKPEDPEARVHYLRGGFPVDLFGLDVSIFGDDMWVGIPGMGPDLSTFTWAGSVRQYNLTNSLLKRTIIPSSDVRWNFGAKIVNNGSSLWIASPNTKDGKGAVSQYSAANGQLKKVIWAPESDDAVGVEDFGREMFCNDDLLIVHSKRRTGNVQSNRVYGFSSVNGDLLWTIDNGIYPDDPNFGYTAELIGERLLLVAGNSGWTFFSLDDPREPLLLMLLRHTDTSDNYAYAFDHNGYYLAVDRVRNNGSHEMFLMDLRQLRELWPYVGTPEDALDWSSLFRSGSQPIDLQADGRYWKVELPDGLIAPESGELILECSEDLQTWRQLLSMTPTGKWTLHPSATRDHALGDDGKVLKIQSQRSSCFLRFSGP